MATVLDVTLFDFFSPIFLFIMVYATVFALLEKVKIFGEGKKGINAIVGFAVAIVFLFSGSARAVLEFALPWYMILGFVALSILFILGIFGTGEENWKQAIIGEDRRVMTWVVVLSVIILIFALSNALGQQYLEKTLDGNFSSVESSSQSTATDSFNDNLYRTLFHPKVLGMLVVLLIGVFAIMFLASTKRY